MKCSWRQYRIQSVVDHENIKRHSSIDERMAIVEGNIKSPAKKNKRFRSAFTTEQVTYLEKEFRKYPYIGNTRRKDVASVLSIPERAVKIWFQNRRMKEKKDVIIKESADNKRTANCEALPYFYVSKLDQSTSSLRNPNLPQKTVERNLEPLVEENLQIKVSTPDLASRSQHTDGSFKDNLKSEINNNGKPNAKHILKTCNSPTRKNSLKSVFSPYSSVPQDLSSNKKLQKKEENNFQEPKTMQELSPPMLASGANTAGSPVIVGGYYPQPYMPPGNMMWKPINMAPTPIISTGLSGGPTNLASPQTLTKVNCTCDCHLQAYSSPVVLQQGGPNPLMQYIITAVPISN